jgi:hypothetical protein
MPAIDNALITTLLNYLTPTGAAGINGTAIGTPLGTTAMRLRLNTTASTNAAAGTEIPTQTSGYTTALGGGWTPLGASTVSSGGTAVGVPLTTQTLVSAGGVVASTGIVSFDLCGNGGQRGFWGLFNAQPILVGSGNSFQVTGGSAGAAGIQISLT